MFDDHFTEAFAFAGIVDGDIQRGACHAHALRCDADAAGLQIAQCDGVALDFLAQPQIAFELKIFET